MKLSPWEPDLRSVVNRIDSADIDLQPDFQRQEVWSLAKKRRLVDTILRDWSIPPVHFVVTSDNRLEVLDGQQRLATVRDFLHDQFSIDAKITPTDPALQPLHGKFYSQLDAALKRKVDNYTIRAFRITEYQPDEPNELFYRLNQPTSLTAGEQRNALFGPAREQLKGLVRVFQDSGNSKETIGFSNARMAYDDIIAKLLFFLEKHTFGIRSSESLISERFKLRTSFSSEIVLLAERAIHFFTTSRLEAGHKRFNKASILSWLLFFARFESNPDFHFMYEFVNIGAHSDRYSREAFVMFEDRSSLRVSDVASVAYRDFALWYTYYITDHKLWPSKIPKDTISRIHSALVADPNLLLAEEVAECLDLAHWTHTL